jgi:IMP cyclohydrolase
MGRSANSRNRIFVKEDNGFLKTKAFDESKVEDPSLIIYYPLKHINGSHIVTNGDQTDTVFESLASGAGFEGALETRDPEPDAPNFTPRISGICRHGDDSYKFSIIKTIAHGSCTGRYFFNYKNTIAGCGHLITTYTGDGSPLPSFEGEPQIVPIFESAQENLEKYWSALDTGNRISILVKTIERNGSFDVILKNKFE